MIEKQHPVFQGWEVESLQVESEFKRKEVAFVRSDNIIEPIVFQS